MPNSQDSRLPLEPHHNHQAGALNNTAGYIVLFLVAMALLFFLPTLFDAANHDSIISTNPIVGHFSLADMVCALLQLAIGIGTYIKINTLLTASGR